jgi:hypothetical protein
MEEELRLHLERQVERHVATVAAQKAGPFLVKCKSGL